MNSRTAIPILFVPLATLIATLTALLLAPTAWADTNTDQFLIDIHDDGFSNSDMNLIAQGVWVCQLLDNGYTPASASAQYLHNNHVTAFQAGQFVGTSVRILCPWNTQPYLGRDRV